MNGGRRPNQGRGTAKQHEPGRGKHPHLSRRGTIQITMINIAFTSPQPETACVCKEPISTSFTSPQPETACVCRNLYI